MTSKKPYDHAHYRQHAKHPISDQLRKARREAGYSLQEFEHKTGIKAVVVGSYERGDRAPSILNLSEWAGHLGYELALVPKGQRVVDPQTLKTMETACRAVIDALTGSEDT